MRFQTIQELSLRTIVIVLKDIWAIHAILALQAHIGLGEWVAFCQNHPI